MGATEQKPWSTVDPEDVGLLEAIRRAVVDAASPDNVDGAGCLLLDGDCALRYAASSSTPAASLEVAEEVCIEGPCHEAFAGEREVRYDDVQLETHWGRLSLLLVTSPVRAVIGIPILVAGQPVGALDVYSARPGAFGDEDIARLHQAAEALARVIRRALDAKLDDAGDELARQLRAALANGHQLRKAAELMVANAGLDRTTAMLRLRQMAAASDRPTIDVAEQVIEHGGPPSAAALASQADAVRRSRREVARLALTDPLTGLANRALFLDHLEQALARAERSGRYPAVVFIDLDRFKTINDSLGHAAGDEVLRVVAQRLDAEVREQDTVARLGGDEFAVLYDAPTQRERAEGLAQRLAAAVARPIRLPVPSRGHEPEREFEVSVRASFGVALLDGPVRPVATDILRDADMAMYAAKSAGGDRLRVFSEEIRAIRQRDIHLDLALRSMLDDHGQPSGGARVLDGIRLVYQPIIDLRGGGIVTVEALARWRHPELGDVPAPDLIATAEGAGLIPKLGEALLLEACTAAARWRARSDGDGPIVAVNISALQLSEPGFVDLVGDVLATTHLSADGLCLELTESRLLGSRGGGLDRLFELRELGVHLALDDFGTGYSSLSYVAELPVTRLKLDRSFVIGLGVGTRGEAVARAVVGLGRSLGLETVAEGVETADQAAYLASLECQLAQGYLYSRPVEAAQVPDLLRAGSLTATAAGG